MKINPFVITLIIFSTGSGGWAETWQHLEYGGGIKCMTASDRYIWIGGEAGALRYDLEAGQFLRVERITNHRGEDVALSGEIVRDIAVDPKGRTWFACWTMTRKGLSGMGLTMMGPTGFFQVSEANGLPSNNVFSLEVDTQGRLWAGTEAGITLLDEGHFTTYTTDDGLYRNDAVDITVDFDGRIWCGFWRGVNAWYDDHWYTWERKRIDYVYRILPGNDRRVYCATKGGVAIYDGERWTMAMNNGDLRKRLISDMAMDRDGKLWCAWGGLDKGLSIYDGKSWDRLTQSSTQGGLASDRAIALVSDRFGRMWIGDRDGGLSIFIPEGCPEVFDGSLVKKNQEAGKSTAERVGRLDVPAPTSPSALLTGQWFSGLSANVSLHSMRPLWMGINAITNQYDDFDIFQHSGDSESEIALESAIDSPEWEAAFDRPILLAQAGSNPPVAEAAKIQIANPKELEKATAEAPFETQENTLVVSVQIGAIEKLAKIEINGFQAQLEEGLEFGGQHLYQFQGPVLLKGIDKIHIEVFDGNDHSLASRDYPVKCSGPAEEMNQPNLVFLNPAGITQDKVIASRGGGGPISVNLTSANKGTVRGLVQDDSGIKSLTVNDEPVQYLVDAPPSQLDDAGMTGTRNVKYFEHNFQLGTGSNTIDIKALDIFNNISEVQLDVMVQEYLSDSDFYQASYAMIVGINKYKNWRPLENAVRDALGVKQLLIDKFEFAPERIYELYDEAATKEGIDRVFKEVAKAERNSRVLIFYAGHGQTTSTRSGKQGYLVPVDGALSTSLKPSLEEIASWISMDELSRQIGYFEAKHILVIVDACYSGLLTAKRSSGFETLLKEDAATAEFIQLADESAVEVITAGNMDEEVLDGGRDGHSIFTAYLLDGLEKGEADTQPDGIITSQELGMYVWQKVYQATGQKQNPQYAKLPGYEEEKGLVLFPIAGKL